MGDGDVPPKETFDDEGDGGWRTSWTREGPYKQDLDNETDPKEKKKIEEKIDRWFKQGGVDWRYGYTKHVAFIIIKFAQAVVTKTDLPEKIKTMTESGMGTVLEAQAYARAALEVLVTAGKFDVFDKCVLPIRQRPNGAIPRAFLGSDVAESGEGLGFKQNRLRRYLRHPGVVPKSRLLNWATYSTKGSRVFDGLNSWFYSIKYDGYSAIWTGTKLVTANGRQTVYTMPKEMRDRLSEIRMPLIGELIIVQEPNAERYVTKEALQAVVHMGAPLTPTARKVAKRMVFMVYDTPSTSLRFEKFSARLEVLKKTLVHYVAGEPRPFKIKYGDHIELVEQVRVSAARGKASARNFEPGKGRASIEATLSAALLAATATENEGLMLTPDEPYLQLYTEKHRRIKLKLLYQFSVTPSLEAEDTPHWYSASNADEEEDEVQGDLDEIRPVGKVKVQFTDAHGKTIDTKINIENDLWFDTGSYKDRPFRVRLARHRWGFHLLYTREATAVEDTRRSISIDDYASFVRPKAVGDFVRKFALETRLLADSDKDLALSPDPDGAADLYALFSARLMHAKVLAKSGRPHFPAHPMPPPSDDDLLFLRPFGALETVTGPFLGEASVTEVRQLVREASLMAEQYNLKTQPYNEWLCQLHRAYESREIRRDGELGKSLWDETVEDERTLAPPEDGIEGYFTSRLQSLPGDPIDCYVRDYEHPHLTDSGRYVIYKLRHIDEAPAKVSFYAPAEVEEEYFVPYETRDLPPRMVKNKLRGESLVTNSILLDGKPLSKLELSRLRALCKTKYLETANPVPPTAGTWDSGILFNYVFSQPLRDNGDYQKDVIEALIKGAKGEAESAAVAEVPVTVDDNAAVPAADESNEYALIQYGTRGLERINDDDRGGYMFYLAKIVDGTVYYSDFGTDTQPKPIPVPVSTNFGETGYRLRLDQSNPVGGGKITNRPSYGLKTYINQATAAKYNESFKSGKFIGAPPFEFTLSTANGLMSYSVTSIFLNEIEKEALGRGRRGQPSDYELYFRNEANKGGSDWQKFNLSQ